MDLGALPILVVVVVLIGRAFKEFSKVSRNRPGSGNDGLPPAGDSGARELFDFLKELKEQNQPASDTAVPLPLNADRNQAKMRAEIREAVRRGREAQEEAVRLPSATAPRSVTLPKPVEGKSDAYVIAKPIEDSPIGEVLVQGPGGLAHAVFATSLSDPRELAKRAMVLREVMGAPVGLRQL